MMEHFKAVGSRAALVGGGMAGFAMLGFILSGANAVEGDDPGLDAITGLGAKVTSYGTAIIAVVVISVGIFLGIKYLRKAVSKA